MRPEKTMRPERLGKSENGTFAQRAISMNRGWTANPAADARSRRSSRCLGAGLIRVGRRRHRKLDRSPANWFCIRALAKFQFCKSFRWKRLLQASGMQKAGPLAKLMEFRKRSIFNTERHGMNSSGNSIGNSPQCGKVVRAQAIGETERDASSKGASLMRRLAGFFGASRNKLARSQGAEAQRRLAEIRRVETARRLAEAQRECSTRQLRLYMRMQ